MLKCILCNSEAVVVLMGDSLCQKHFDQITAVNLQRLKALTHENKKKN